MDSFILNEEVKIMTFIVKQKFDTYMDYVHSSNSAYKSSLEGLSERAKNSLNELLDGYEISSLGYLSPDNLWVNLLISWSDKECLVDNLKLLKKDEYLKLVEEGTLQEYIKKEYTLIEETIASYSFAILDHEKDQWIILAL